MLITLYNCDFFSLSPAQFDLATEAKEQMVIVVGVALERLPCRGRGRLPLVLQRFLCQRAYHDYISEQWAIISEGVLYAGDHVRDRLWRAHKSEEVASVVDAASAFALNHCAGLLEYTEPEREMLHLAFHAALYERKDQPPKTDAERQRRLLGATRARPSAEHACRLVTELRRVNMLSLRRSDAPLGESAAA